MDTLIKQDFDLDIDLETPCQHSAHPSEHGDAPVEFLVQVRCPFCSHFGVTLQCRIAVGVIFTLGVGTCNRGCGQRFRLTEYPSAYRVVPV